MKNNAKIIISGAIIGIISIILVAYGNPKNMGVCIACFLRDISGALGLHNANVVQYIRPEIIGIVLGAFCISLFSKEFSSRGGSSPFIRFILGFMVVVGALVFLGCPARMVLRLAGGDLNAVVGLVGFTVGILLGVFFLNRGFSLKRSYKLSKAEGFFLPAINVGLLIFLVVAPGYILFSKTGPGSMHAPIAIALVGGLVVGALAQKTRLCFVGGIRDLILFKDTYLISGFLAIFVAVLVGNLIIGNFSLGFTNQPIAHNDGVWNFLGMVIVGWGSVLLGGCPLRQLILSGEGNTDSVISVVGMVVGAAFAHNFGLASSAKGATYNGKISVGIMIGLLLVISFIFTQKISIDKKAGAKNEKVGC